MWPWGHAAVGYLLYSGWVRARDGRRPTGAAAIAVALGTQFPDLVDKPLSWSLGVLPTGRSLAHSWLLAAVVLLVAWVVLARVEGRGAVWGMENSRTTARPNPGHRTDTPDTDPQDAGHRATLAAFGVGWLSHGLADAAGVFLAGERLAYLNFLAWPLAATPPYDTEPSLLAHLAGFEPTPYVLAQFALAAAAAWTWRADGWPGVALLRDGLGSLVGRRGE